MMRAMSDTAPPRRFRLPRFIGFLLVGTGGFVVDAGTLSLYLWVVPDGFLAGRLFSFFVAVTFTWYLNRRFTFGAPGRPSLREWARFVAVNLVGGGVNVAVYSVLVSYIDAFRSLPVLAVAVGSIAGLFVNFLGASRIVFRPGTP